jgi:hypothetical protein
MQNIKLATFVFFLPKLSAHFLGFSLKEGLGKTEYRVPIFKLWKAKANSGHFCLYNDNLPGRSAILVLLQIGC